MTPISDYMAMSRIHALLDGTEWTASTAGDIADIVRETGRHVRDPFTHHHRRDRPCPLCAKGMAHEADTNGWCWNCGSPDCEGCDGPTGPRE